MEADHVEVLLGDRAPVTHKNIVHVLVMSIRHGHVREAAARLVHSVLRGVDRVVPVRIFLQKFGKCDLCRELVSERKGVTNNSSLGLTEDAARSSAAQLEEHRLCRHGSRMVCWKELLKETSDLEKASSHDRGLDVASQA